MTIYAATGFEGWFEGGTSAYANTSDPFAAEAELSTSIGTRDTAYARKTGLAALKVVLDANNESGMMAPRLNGTIISLNLETLFVINSFEFDDATPAAAYKISEVVGSSTFFNLHHFRVNTNGDWAFRSNSGGSDLATWASPGLSVNTKYWLKYHFDATNGRVRLYVAADDGNNMVSSWGSAVIDYTDATQTGKVHTLFVGGENFKTTNANVTLYTDDVSLSSDDPDQPRISTLFELDGDGFYTPGEWVEGGGGVAEYLYVNDPVNAASDKDTSYLKTVPGVDNTDRFSATLESGASAGLVSTDVVHAALGLAFFGKTVAGGANDAWVMLRANSTDVSNPTALFTSATTPYKANWGVWPDVPGGSGWIPSDFDELEAGLQFQNTSVTANVWKVSWLAVLAVSSRVATDTQQVFVC